MKLRTIIGSALALTFGLCSLAFASDYYPPERIHCSLSTAHKLSCEGFNHQYLAEDTYTADMTTRDETFLFHSGVAYYTPDMNESSVFFTYKNSYGKIVKIKSTNTQIRPNLQTGSWFQHRQDKTIYLCDAGYMNCPITNLPGLHK